MIYPRPLKPGDKIAILSPASKIDCNLVDSACEAIIKRGYTPIVCEHCKGADGSYSGTATDRLCDIKTALANPEVRAILCSRGGYGVVHLLDSISADELRKDPKWMIGFSDISAMHAAFNNAGIVSVHASMAKHLTERPNDDCSNALFDIITGKLPTYKEQGDCRNREGAAEGRIVGGNLAVLAGLISTPYDLLKKDHILFIEDVSEAIYKIERILYTLKLNGVLASTKALIVGQFTDYKPSKDFNDMNDMIERIVKDYDFPVAYNFHVGHIDRNLPIIEGANAKINITKESVELTFKHEEA